MEHRSDEAAYEHFVIDKYSVNPAKLLPALPRLIRHESYGKTFAALLTTFLGAMVIGAQAHGRLGELDDFAPWLDVRRIAGDSSVSAGPASFPLLRDYPSLSLAVIACWTIVLVPWQWRLLTDAIPSAVRAGAIVPRLEGDRNLLQEHATRVARLIDLVARRQVHFVIFGVAALLATLLVVGAGDSDLFAILAPDHLHGHARSVWLDQIYRSWWASTDHPLGALVFGVLTTVVLYVVTLQNIAGVAAMYYVWKLPRVSVMREQPFSPLSNDGWQGLALAYRSVYFSLSLHGLAITLIVVVMGVSVTWVAVLVVAWVVVAPTYLSIPRAVFKKALLKARAADAQDLKKIARPFFESRNASADAYRDFAWFRDELQALADRPIAPLKMGRARLVSVGITIFSLVAAAVQTWVAWRSS